MAKKTRYELLPNEYKKLANGRYECTVCGRSFYDKPGFSRHLCKGKKK
jgi:hypothetical protein